MATLGLSADEWHDTVEWDCLRSALERKEDSKIAAMQDEVNGLLLDRDGMGFTSINSATYQALLTRHLAAFTNGKMDFSTASKRDLVNAQSLLTSRGLPLSLIGEWVELPVGTPNEPAESGSEIMLGLEEGQEYATESIGQDHVWQDTTRLKVMNTAKEQFNVSKGRPPVRRKYVHINSETPSARPKVISTGQSLKQRSSNAPFLTLNHQSPHQPHQMRLPGSIITDDQNIVMQDVRQAPPKLDVTTSDTSPIVNGLAQSISLPISTAIPQADTSKDTDPMTIVVQPKRTWSGTAKPARTTFSPDTTLQTPEADASIYKMWKSASSIPSVSRQSSEALERLRIESMKYSGKSIAGLSEPAKVKNASTSASLQVVVNDTNSKQLVIGTSVVSSTTPKERFRRANNTSSTTKTSIATAISPTATPRELSTRTTPDLPDSGSSTRSPMATRKPSRYRDGLSHAVSPTESITGPRVGNKQVVAKRTETNGLFSSGYQLGNHKAPGLKIEDMPIHQDLATVSKTIRKSSLGLSEKKQAVRQQSTQPIQPQHISSDLRNVSRRGSSAESVSLIATSIEVTNSTVPGPGGKVPRYPPSKPLILGAPDAAKPAESKVGGKAPRKGPSKPPSSAGKSPQKTPSKPLPPEVISAGVPQSDITREAAKGKTTKPKVKRSKTNLS
ncbi:hypothetical protein MMC34_003344 [Xylographa carneopallida]|nr:hypothetical protein [Xylographa carneopallida]